MGTPSAVSTFRSAGQTREQRAGVGCLTGFGKIVFPATSVWMSILCIATGIRGVTTRAISVPTSQIAEDSPGRQSKIKTKSLPTTSKMSEFSPSPFIQTASQPQLDRIFHTKVHSGNENLPSYPDNLPTCPSIRLPLSRVVPRENASP